VRFSRPLLILLVTSPLLPLLRAWLSSWAALQRYWDAWSNAPATATASTHELGRGRLRPALLSL